MTDSLFSVENKVALVTGGASGIGTMIARGLIRRGAKVYITGRDQARTEEVAAQISSDGGTCIGLSAELSDPEGPAALASAFSALEPKLDILVNNAGTLANTALATSTVADWDVVFNVNLRAVFFLVQQLLPQLKASASAEDPARIINIGSIGGLHIPNWEAHNYGVSKAAVHHLTRSLAKTLGKDHITVNAIAPGPFPSRMTNTESETVKKSVAANIPLGRPGEAEDMEGLVVFLASRAGAYVNGTTIPLEGGYIAAL